MLVDEEVGAIVPSTWHGAQSGVEGFYRAVADASPEYENDAVEGYVQEFEHRSAVGNPRRDRSREIGWIGPWSYGSGTSKGKGGSGGNSNVSSSGGKSFWDWAMGMGTSLADAYRMQQEAKLMKHGGNVNVGRPWWLRPDYPSGIKTYVGPPGYYGGGQNPPRESSTTNTALLVGGGVLAALLILRR